MNPCPALTASRPFIFHFNLSNTDEVALVAYLGKIYLAKGTASSISVFLSKLPSHYLTFYREILLI